MAHYVFCAVHLKYRMLQLFCCHILVIAIQGKTQTRVAQFTRVPKFNGIIENANHTILNIIGEVRSSLECVMFCSKHDKCKSVFIYKEENNVCQLRSSVLRNMTETVAKAEARYYKRVEKTEGCSELNNHPNSVLMGDNSSSMTTELKRTHECNYICTLSESRTVNCQANTTRSHMDYECHDVINVALKRDAAQSSTIDMRYASAAVDGIKSSMFKHCAHTDNDDDERWWMVNFGHTAVILGISMLNTNMCEKRMSDISICIGSSLDMMGLCAYYAGPGLAEETVLVMCSTPMTGQYLKLTGGGSDGNCIIGPFLQLCEIQAMGFFTDKLTCGEGLFECHTKLCIAKDTHCDMFNHCGDWSDEVGCSCPSNAFECNTGTCIPFYLRCNGVDDCGDESDEPAGCVSCTGALCPNGLCIGHLWICDNVNDCGDNSDEMGCNESDCDVYPFRCPDGTCLSLQWICDGYDDCGDLSDEYLC